MEDLFEKRIEICKKCPLWKDTPTGPVCDSNKYINIDKNVSYFKRNGFYKGCGCKLYFRAKNPRLHCVINLW